MTTTSEAVMGFEDETAELIQRLVRGPKHLDVVSLVGMPGIGEESWCLLQKKVFGEESCAPQLEKIGVKIAQSCGGLPLAIILVAGVLAKLNKEEIRWEEVANGLSSCAAGDTQMYMDIIELSFRFLPSQLKRCFLYFGGFCEDELLVRKLIQLWVAEEYAVGNELKSAEDEAKGYVMELIDNNLVMVVQRSFFGEVR